MVELSLLKDIKSYLSGASFDDIISWKSPGMERYMSPFEMLSALSLVITVPFPSIAIVSSYQSMWACFSIISSGAQ